MTGNLAIDGFLASDLLLEGFGLPPGSTTIGGALTVMPRITNEASVNP